MKREIKIEEDVDFQVQKFNFNRYELEDGSKLRIAAVPVKIFRTEKVDQRGVPIYHVMSTNIVSAVVPSELRGPPGEIVKIDPKDTVDVDFRVIEEPRNSYMLADSTIIRMKTTVNQILKSEHRNQFGEPSYFISSTNSISAVPTRRNRRKGG